MDPKPSGPSMMLAPARGSGAAVRFPSAREFPRIDERLVEPETREQIVRGRRVVAMPSNPRADLTVLDRWLVRAATATSIDTVLADEMV